MVDRSPHPSYPPRARLPALVVAAFVIAGCALEACLSQQQRAAVGRQLVELGDQGCAELRAAGSPDPRLEAVCLTRDEIVIAVEAVRRARAAAAAAVAPSASPLTSSTASASASAPSPAPSGSAR